MPAWRAVLCAILVDMPPTPSPVTLSPAWMPVDRRSGGLRGSVLRWGPSRVGGKEAGLVGEDEQEVGADQGGDEGGEVVVVADFDLFGGDGVVLVDDGDDAIIEQRGEGVARR